MAIVSVAILISFHLKAEASALEKRIALPFGLVFWLLSMACLAAGLNNYIKTVSRYSRRQALVQSGTGTQVVSILSILARCFFVLIYGLEHVLIGVMVVGLYGRSDGDCGCMCTIPVDECAKWRSKLKA